jgi:hypothetical protein
MGGLITRKNGVGRPLKIILKYAAAKSLRRLRNEEVSIYTRGHRRHFYPRFGGRDYDYDYPEKNGIGPIGDPARG